MKYLVIGIDCPGCGTIKDIRIKYDDKHDLYISTDREGDVRSINYHMLKYIDTSRIVYVYIEEK